MLTQNISINIFKFVFARKKCLNIFICQLYFQICFAVQIFGLNVAYPIFIGRFKNKQIAWQRLVLFYFYYFAWIDICPSFLFEFSSLNAVSCRQLVIFFSIRFVSFIIFKSIFDHWQNNQWHQIVSNCGYLATDRYWFNRLHASDKYEINILDLLKLIEQIKWYKIERSILCCINHVFTHLFIFLLLPCILC